MSGQDDRRRPPGPPRGAPTQHLRAQPTEVLPGPNRPGASDPFAQPATEVLPRQPTASPWDPNAFPPSGDDPVRQAIARAAQEPTAFDLQFPDVPRPISGVASQEGFSGERTQDDTSLPFSEPVPGSDTSDGFSLSEATELHGGSWQPSLDDIGDAFDRALSGPFPAPPAPVAPPPTSSPGFDGGSQSGALPPLDLEPAFDVDFADDPPPDPPLGSDDGGDLPPKRRGFLGVALLVVLLLVASAGGVGAYFHFVEGVELPGLAGLLPSSLLGGAAEGEPAPPTAEARADEASTGPASTDPAEAAADDEGADDGPDNGSDDGSDDDGAPAEPAVEVAAAGPGAPPAKEAKSAPSAEDDDATDPSPEAGEERAEGASSADEISPKWKNKVIYVGIPAARDKSKSGVKRLERTLKEGFGLALKQDRHAKWRVKNRRVGRGHVVYLDVVDVAAQPREDGYTVAVSCRATAYKKPGRAPKVVQEARATASVDGPASKLLRAQLTRDAVRSCSFSLSTDFVGAVLR